MRSLLLALSLFAAAVPLAGRPTDGDDVVQVVTDDAVNGVQLAASGAALRTVFHPDFRLRVLTDGAIHAVTRDEWISRTEGGTANAGAARPR